MLVTRSLLFVLTFAVAVLPVYGAETSEVESLLKRPIIDPKLPLEEVREYAASRIPPVPEVKNVAEWEAYAERVRRETLDRVVFRGEAARWRDAETKVEWLEAIEGGPGYRIKKLRYEALPGLWIPALLYEPENLQGRVPVMLNVNGHAATGKTTDYKQIRCINLAKRGMLALNPEWLGMGQLRTDGYLHYRMNQLDLCGTSGLAPFYLAMQRGLDLLLSLEHADANRVGVAGLSGGGWQTIIISSLDPRVTLANPVAGYSSLLTRARFPSDLGDSEQTPADFATTTDYSILTAMLAPRPTLLTYNANDDCCFRSSHALPPLLQAAEPIFKLYGKPANLRSHVNHDPGTHNFEVDNRQQFYQLVGDHFYPGDADFNAKEIPCEAEVKDAETLFVEIPEDNADFHTLATALAGNLPRERELPTSQSDAEFWKIGKRAALAALVRAKQPGLQAIPSGEQTIGETHAKFWRFRIGGAWSVPAVELTRGEANETVLLVADAGRAAATAEAEELLANGGRVLAVDPFYFGESKIMERDFLLALLLSAVGDRPLGLQATQVAGIARWAAEQFPRQPVRLVAIGHRASLYTLVAAALETKAIGSVELRGSLGSLKEVIEQNLSVREAPELFCFGLLEQFDIAQLAALVAPRPVRFVEPSQRARDELAGLKAWYAVHEVDFDPLP
jgi:hypothetical protein